MSDRTPKQAAAEAGAWSEPRPTALLVLADGTVLEGIGLGAETALAGELCFNTAMTGYQEILTDPSYAGQIITFTFPHIGNVGANPDDVEADGPHALGMIVREDVTQPSNFRAVENLDGWMRRHKRIGLSGIDTRALTRRIRSGGAPNGVIAHSADGVFNIVQGDKEAVDAIAGITTAVGELSNLTVAIASAVEEQAVSTQEMAVNLGGVSSSATSTGQLAEAVRSVSGELAEHSASLKGSVDIFLKAS